MFEIQTQKKKKNTTNFGKTGLNNILVTYASP